MRSRLADPPVIVAALLLAGLAAAVAAARGPSLLVTVLVGALVGAVVYAVALGPGLVIERFRPSGASRAPTSARPWLARADAAAAGLRRQRRSAGDPHLARLLAEAATRAATVTDRLRERARAVTAIHATAAGIDLGRLRREQERLAREAAEAPPGRLRAEKESAARAAAERIASQERLAELRDLLLAGIESTVLRLEAVVARGSVLLSIGIAGGDTDTTDADLDALTAELTVAQDTLDQTEEVTRQLLGQLPP